MSLHHSETTVEYTVQEGDTLACIAARHGVTVSEIIEANPGIGGNLACFISERYSDMPRNSQGSLSPSTNAHILSLRRAIAWQQEVSSVQFEDALGVRGQAQRAVDIAEHLLVANIVSRCNAYGLYGDLVADRINAGR